MTNKNTYFCSKNIKMNLFGIDFGHFPLLLAPMEGVTDAPFRHVCKEFGADIVYSEFISSDGLIRDAVKSIRKLSYTEAERPFGVQIFGNAVEPMVEAALYAERYKPDIVYYYKLAPSKNMVMLSYCNVETGLGHKYYIFTDSIMAITADKNSVTFSQARDINLSLFSEI